MKLTPQTIAALTTEERAEILQRTEAAFEAEIERLMKCAVRNFRAGKFHKAIGQIEAAYGCNGGNWNLRGRFLLRCKRVCVDAILEANAKFISA